MQSKESPNISPKISVVIASYNYGKYIERAIESVLTQTLPKNEYEIIVVDDGSTDNTQEILKKYQDRIRVIKQENQGYVKAANRGMQEADGEYVIRLDADDEFLPEILQHLSNSLEKNADAAFAYCDYYELNEQTGERKLISLKENVFQCVAIGIMFRKSTLEKVGFYTQELVFPEYDLILKIQQKGLNGVYMSVPLFIYHRHAGSLTTNKGRVQLGIQQLEQRYGKKIKIREY